MATGGTWIIKDGTKLAGVWKDGKAVPVNENRKKAAPKSASDTED